MSLRPHQQRELEQIESNRHPTWLARTLGAAHKQILPATAKAALVLLDECSVNNEPDGEMVPEGNAIRRVFRKACDEAGPSAPSLNEGV